MNPKIATLATLAFAFAVGTSASTTMAQTGAPPVYGNATMNPSANPSANPTANPTMGATQPANRSTYQPNNPLSNQASNNSQASVNAGKYTEASSSEAKGGWFPKPSLPSWMKPESKPKGTPAEPSMWAKTKAGSKAAFEKTKSNTKAAWEKTKSVLNPFDDESTKKSSNAGKSSDTKEKSMFSRTKKEDPGPATTGEWLDQKRIPY